MYNSIFMSLDVHASSFAVVLWLLREVNIFNEVKASGMFCWQRTLTSSNRLSLFIDIISRLPKFYI